MAKKKSVSGGLMFKCGLLGLLFSVRLGLKSSCNWLRQVLYRR